MEQSTVQAQGYRVGGNIQGEEAGDGKLLRVWGNSGGVIIEGAHGEAAWQKCTADKGGEYGGGGGYLCGFLPPSAEDSEMPSDELLRL